MFRLLSQILIVILAVGLVAGATYLIVNQTANSTSFSTDRPAFDGSGLGPGDSQGLRGGEGAEGGSSIAWLDVLKNVTIVAIFTTVIGLVRLILKRKPRLQLVDE